VFVSLILFDLEKKEVYTYKFPLDVKVVFSIGIKVTIENHTVKIAERQFEKSFPIPVDENGQLGKLQWSSIDPQLRILKQLYS
jgi:hypothetical protein